MSNIPKADFGQPIKLGGGLFIRLESKGDKIKFRFAAGAVYEGKHFKKQNGNTIASFCPRIMADKDCADCTKYYEYRELMRAEENKEQKDALDEEARKYKPKITFYYPILDREDGRAKILKTVITVRENLEAEVAAGVKVLDHDYVLTRIEKSPANYYSLVRSPETKEFTKEEQVEFEKAKELKMEKILGHITKESSLKIEPDKES